ncbi:DUF2235 domain-containing protein [Geomonas sp. RF6]|uniref:DUF2235 domain-containing protein n=1 Tax=Geomonas sp. RF6 TaxID=2897342 RepID=UPI001E5B16F7|nr:DUF2235 domain-containing protein [Geomonas sp. RF6]UFS71156.1 DUF2235 domain-containing protein [Geomonas sp. RF6]
MKRIIVCCDGTWELPYRREEELSAPTNVAKIAELIAPGDERGVGQFCLYQDGTADLPDETEEASLGTVITHCIQTGYRFIASRFSEGDEIWLFGFSRGAYIARSIIGMIHNSGLLRPEELDKLSLAYELYRNRYPETHPDSGYSAGFRDTFSVPAAVKFLGVWDTVGHGGIPRSILAGHPSNSWCFHSLNLSSIVENAYHAVAIDERRPDYAPCLWESGPATKGEQVLFPGVHSDVGGGYHEAGLSDCALAWMVCKARGCGLGFAPGKLCLAPDPHGVLHDLRQRELPEGEVERRTFRGSALSLSAQARKESPEYEPENLPETPLTQCCKNRGECANFFKCH